MKQQRIEPGPPGAYDEVLRELGVRHEQEHLLTFPTVLNLGDQSIEDAFHQTTEAVLSNEPVIYQPALMTTLTQNGQTYPVVGLPDFLIKTDDGYAVRDVKMSRRINEKDHPEIIQQLHLYGWLYEQVFSTPPIRLEVFSGTSEVVDIPWDDWDMVLDQLGYVIQLRESNQDPYSPVGWSKCNGCGYFDRCWPAAVERKDVALIEGVDQGLATALRDLGVNTYPELPTRFDVGQLAEFKRPWGSRMQRVGKAAESVLRMAEVMESGQEVIIQQPDIPASSNYVMFDLEGLPPHLDELDKIFLWGMQVFGETPSEFIAAQAGFGPDGDKEGWDDFLVKADTLFKKYGDIPFVHWHHYEKTHIRKYIERYGDPDGIAERVLGNLFDLLPVVKKSIALPLPSYSLKVVEQYVGFKRSQDEYGGDWAMAQYIKATETGDEQLRQEIMDQVLTYNKEDLAATWAVLMWGSSK
ncbi:TM0106 family RecB-like putative nuclease [Candidatus Neomarinimicrobiota bacterium]